MKESRENKWTPFDAGVVQNPYPMYAWLREHAPVYRASNGDWIITHYSTQRMLLKDPRLLAGNRVQWLAEAQAPQSGRFQNLIDALTHFMVFRNPPSHTHLRKSAQHAWSNRDVSTIIEKNIGRLDISDSGESDVASRFSQPLPALTMAQLLGLPMEDHPFLLSTAERLIQTLDLYLSLRNLDALNEEMGRLRDYFVSVAHQKKKTMDESIMGNLIRAISGDFTLDDAVYTGMFLLISGVETTASLISLCVWHALSKAYWNEFASHPEKIPAFVEEVLRYDAPLQILARRAQEDIQLGDHFISRGDAITLCLGSANRDERIFDQADHFICGRVTKSISFGHGIHYCLGDWLAKEEVILLLTHLTKRYPHSFINLETPVFRNNLSIRSITRLPVIFR
jgi:cytochrome P450